MMKVAVSKWSKK